MQADVYVYGWLAAGTEVPAVGGVAGGVAETMDLGGFAALVTRDVDAESFGVADDLVAHTTVLDTVAATQDVVPLAFGTILPSPVDAAARSALQEAYDDVAGRIAGAVQCTLTVRYLEETILSEIVGDDPRIARLRRETAGTGEYEARAEKLRLGQLVVEALDAKAEKDGEAILARLMPVLRDAAPRERRQAEDVIDVAMLVDRDGVEDLARTCDSLAGEFAGRARFRFLGPQAPYDFVREA
jgi:hypothetical protein